MGAKPLKSGNRARLVSVASLTAVALAVVSGAAQSVLAQTRPDPLDAAAPVPPVRYESSLTRPAALQETAVGSWKDANETVNRIGGWKAYAREAATSTSQGEAASPATASPAAPSPLVPSPSAPATPGPASSPRHSGH